MKKQAVKRTMGFCAAAEQGIVSRWIEGALHYVAAMPGLAFRDISFLQDLAMDDLAPAPP